ncbi:low affinity iron permease family protein [Bdellovibrio sp. HCB337]|uniref:low affinity iron permease family protein n=1 Tax=Bdellovibrio sp. HCB337 TaxID=3394358 RepID=UPI0039A400D3
MAQNSLFSRFAKKSAHVTGLPGTFLIAVFVILAWAITGPLFQFSDTWQLVINTGTTIITFLMVFLIQNTQNRDSVAVQLKLDELIRATRSAHDSLMDLEELEEAELEQIRAKFEEAAAKARNKLRALDSAFATFNALEKEAEDLTEEPKEQQKDH